MNKSISFLVLLENIDNLLTSASSLEYMNEERFITNCRIILDDYEKIKEKSK